MDVIPKEAVTVFGESSSLNTAGSRKAESQPFPNVYQKKGKATVIPWDGRKGSRGRKDMCWVDMAATPTSSPSGQLEDLNLAVTGWKGVLRSRREM